MVKKNLLLRRLCDIIADLLRSKRSLYNQEKPHQVNDAHVNFTWITDKIPRGLIKSLILILT